MSWNILNAFGIFEFIDHMIENGIHENSFVTNPVIEPDVYNVLNLPKEMLSSIKQEAIKRHGRLTDPCMLKYSYEAIIQHCDQPTMNKKKKLRKELEILDARRSIDSKKIFPELYKRVLN